MSLRLYAADTANCRRVTVALEEMGLAYTPVPLNLAAGEQRTAAFIAISPNHQVPALVDPDLAGGATALCESGAILMYLAERTGQFFPTSGPARITTLQWFMQQIAGFGPAAGKLLHAVEDPGVADDDPFPGRFRAEVLRHYAVMDRRLGEVEYLADALSIADFAAVGWVSRHVRHRIALEDFPAVARWYATLKSRPGVSRGLSCSLVARAA